MTTIKYYRIDTPEVRAAWATYVAENVELDKEAAAFSALFEGAKPVYIRNLHGRALHGLRFEPTRPKDLWTVAQASEGYVQRPRTRLGATAPGADRKALMGELARLDDLYSNNRPKTQPSLDPVWAAIGTDWGQLLFHKFGMVERDGVIYAATDAKLAAHCEEITGTAYEAATKEKAA